MARAKLSRSKPSPFSKKPNIGKFRMYSKKGAPAQLKVTRKRKKKW